MRFARVQLGSGADQRVRPVLVKGDRLCDLTPWGDLADGSLWGEGLAQVRSASAANALSDCGSIHDVAHWESPVVRPGKVVGIGLNYHDHAREIGAAIPTEPVVFLKATTSVSGPYDDICVLPGSTSTDYEVELGVVVGSRLSGSVGREEALEAVAGYVLAQDISDRSLQLDHGGTWTKGKSADTFCPLGPWVVTPDELCDPQAVRLHLTVDGETRQDGSTSDMIFSVAQCLAYLAELMTLEPGDIVITGTPAGVAMGQPEPKPYLRDGQLIVADGGVLGQQRTRVLSPAPLLT